MIKCRISYISAIYPDPTRTHQNHRDEEDVERRRNKRRRRSRRRPRRRIRRR
jgi:hypothetical protein